MTSRQFSAGPTTIREILRRGLGLKKFARIEVPHQLNPSQQIQRVEAATLLLQILQLLQPNAFDGFATGDESWFQHVYMSNSMFAPSRDLAATRAKDADWTKRTMLTIFFTSRRLIVLEVLPTGTTCTQHDFISRISPDLDGKKLRYRRKNGRKTKEQTNANEKSPFRSSSAYIVEPVFSLPSAARCRDFLDLFLLHGEIHAHALPNFLIVLLIGMR
jgi:hypothetical protein